MSASVVLIYGNDQIFVARSIRSAYFMLCIFN